MKHHTVDPFGQVAMVIIFTCKDGFLNLQLLVQPHEQLPPSANKLTVEVNFPNYKKRLISVVDLLTLICTH
jgi:hypothetical protein